MTDNRIQSIVILGGGTAGWMAAAALAKRFNPQLTRITLIESADIGTIGVGEATVPFIKEFLSSLDIDERDFMQHTQATYKLAIEFDGWKKAGASFLHPFSGYGAAISKIPFHHFWIKMMAQQQAEPLDTYCLASQIARHHKFALPKPSNNSDTSAFNYAFHFDAGLFAKYLSKLAQALGVVRIEGRVEQVMQHPDSGFIEALQLTNGETISGDFFIDCSGFRGLLIEQTLKTGYETWAQWLPCDTAVALPSSNSDALAPYTRSLACGAGWQWRIPLQHRTGNGYVYASSYISDADALTELQRNLEGDALAEPHLIKFTTGMRKQTWNKNVFSLGLASGFMEPLESTSIYMIQSGINTLIDYFPGKHWHASVMDEVNNTLRIRQEKLRDFLILHYKLNGREGEAFWDDCRHMKIPDSLAAQIELYQQSAQVSLGNLDFFRTSSWLAMFAGLDFMPEHYHPFVDNFDTQEVARELRNIASSIRSAVMPLPSHREFITRNLGK